MTDHYRDLLASAAAICGEDERLWGEFLKGLSPGELRSMFHEWHWQWHGGQAEPGGDWTVWVLMAGRGFGKTRAGAEWVWGRVRQSTDSASGQVRPTPGPSLPGRGEPLRIALVGATREDAVRVMVEGPSGLLALARAGEEVRWGATRGEVALPGGSQAFVYSAEAPEALRGPEHHFAWADELAKWAPGKGEAGASVGSSRGERAWDNLMMGLRLGARPRAVVTTTPRTVPLLRRVLALPGVAMTHGRTVENLHLPDAFKAWASETYGGTRLGRQELDGEWIEEVEGSLFPREMLEKARVRPEMLGAFAAGAQTLFRRIVVGVDPPASADGDACGIVVCAEGGGETLYVLADCSVSGLRPEGWARAVASAAEAWGADRVVAEKNNGGDMVESVLRSAEVMMPVKLVHASRGKVARAEPVAALFEAGRAKLAGRFPELEDELAGMLAGGGYAGPSRSPDRADAMVWACHALMRRGAEPRVFAL